jgi:hypothetical protein
MLLQCPVLQPFDSALQYKDLLQELLLLHGGLLLDQVQLGDYHLLQVDLLVQQVSDVHAWHAGGHVVKVPGCWRAGSVEVGGVVILSQGYGGGDGLHVEHGGGVIVSIIQSCHEGHFAVLMGRSGYVLRGIFPIMCFGIIKPLNRFLVRPPILGGIVIGLSVRFVDISHGGGFGRGQPKCR